MAMQEVVCAHCGAINRSIAYVCWRCLEPLSERPAASVHTAEPVPEPRPATA
jgi:predicted amidophosphoribosyltransferase